MSKYRLRKWYPSLPSRWKQLDEVIITNDCCDNPPNNEYARPEEFHRGHWYGLSKREVENNPEYWERVEQPLFTTEDDVDIYEGDSYWYVTENYKIGERECPYYSHDDNFIATYSNKEMAKEHVKRHQPRYSKADIGKAITNTLNFNRDHIIDEFLSNLYE